jgi:HEAT repeat protein
MQKVEYFLSVHIIEKDRVYMSDIDQGQSGDQPLEEDGDIREPQRGFVHAEEKADATDTDSPTAVALPRSGILAATTAALNQAPARSMEREGTLEHLAARRPISPLDTTNPAIKERLATLRTKITSLLTEMRWGGQPTLDSEERLGFRFERRRQGGLSISDTAERLIPLLDIGPIPQWRSTLIPFLLEIDRAGSLIPVWIEIINKDDPQDLPADASPAETMIGRARRYGILMLGNYKYGELPAERNAKSSDLASFLGQLSTNPTTSLYATQSLVKQNTTASIQALVSALKDAEGWAKVDVVEGCLALKLTRFNDLLIASGLDCVSGLENYVAIPLYRSIPLEMYLMQETRNVPRLGQQAALIFAQVIQDSTTPPAAGVDTLPVLFERPLQLQATALFEGARRNPSWQYTIALHRLAFLLGRYWGDISRGLLQNPRILEQVYPCFPMMPEVERWIDGPGRDVLLKTLNDSEEEAFAPTVKVLGELRDPRAISMLLSRIESTREITNREQALYLGAMCDTLGRLGDRRAVIPMLQLAQRTIALSNRISQPKRRDNLPTGDPAIPESIVLGAIVRACGQLNDNSALDLTLLATNDLDPYVRIQAIEALKRIERTSQDIRSRIAVREALSDPRDTVVRSACQLAVQYRDTEAVPMLRRIIETRPELAPSAYDALRQLGQ